VDVDIKGFFDSIDHAVVRDLLQKRIADPGIIRLIGKWLNAGVLEGQDIINTETGTPQGGVISPLLANICLHYIMDEWFERDVQPRLRGKSFLVRYADDFVIGCEHEDDARRIKEVLPKRMQRFNLSLNMQKTKLAPFAMPRGKSKGDSTFDFLGFTHYWGKTKKGWWVIKRKTAKTRLKRALKRIHQWCREHMHDPLKAQCRTLNSKLQGHFRYYGIQCNYRAIRTVHYRTVRCWKHWLGRRDTSKPLNWQRFNKILLWFPISPPRTVHAWM
jgi:group II intron reverse transcriptase/maturase